MVANHKVDNVVDPKLQEIPSSKELKRIILVALRCVDPNINDRPKMGDVLHMLEPCDMLLNNVRAISVSSELMHVLDLFFFFGRSLLTMPLSDPL